MSDSENTEDVSSSSPSLSDERKPAPMSDTHDVTPEKTAEQLRIARADAKRYREERNEIREELESLRKSRDTLKGQLEAQKKDFETRIAEREAAIASSKQEVEKMTAEMKLSTERAVVAAEAKAVAARLGAHDPSDLVRLSDLSDLARDENGNIPGLQERLEKIREEKKWLFNTERAPATETGTTAASTPKPNQAPSSFDLKAMTPEQYAAEKAKFLRSPAGYQP